MRYEEVSQYVLSDSNALKLLRKHYGNEGDEVKPLRNGNSANDTVAE